jgi:hypothetical protein
VRYRIFGAFAVAFALASAATLWPGAARAAHPLLTEDTGTQGKGNAQLELTFDGFRDRLAGVKVRGAQSAALLSYGIADPADLQIGLPYGWLEEDDGQRRSTRGVNDASIDIKWRFFERGAFSLAVKPGITLPTGDADKFLGAGRVTWGALLIGSYEPGVLAFHAHLGYRDFRNTIGAKTALWQATGAMTWQVLEKLKLVTDVSRETNPVPGYSTPLDYVLVGAIWTPRKDLDLDIGYRYGASKPALDAGVLAGVTLRW